MARSKQRNTDWARFEEAVASFLQALEPGAKVTHDVRLPDRDTGRPRQRDVWIEAMLFRNLPVNILVSCKRWSTKIDEQDMDAFIGELGSSGAHKGVVYSYAGFSGPAIEKAKARGISCCKLYENQAADIPQVLFVPFHCCTPAFCIHVNPDAMDEWGGLTFREVFGISDPDTKDQTTALDYLLQEFSSGEQKAAIKIKKGNRLTDIWAASVQIQAPEKSEPLLLTIQGKWRFYKATLEAHLLDGSYSFTEGGFVGSQTSPWIDLKGPAPGPDWELVVDPPAKLQSPFGLVVLSGGNVRSSLEKNLFDLKIKECGENNVAQTDPEQSHAR
jgi:hypothetical protein